MATAPCECRQITATVSGGPAELNRARTALTGLMPDPGRHRRSTAVPAVRRTAFLGAVTAGARVDFAGTDLFTAGSGAFTAQRHVEDLRTLSSQLRPDHTGS